MISKGSKTISLSDIFDYKTEFDILSFYFDIDRIPVVINSPFREDKSPSFGLYYNSSNRIIFHDFSTDEYGGLIDIFIKTWKLPFQSCVEKIHKDIIESLDEKPDKIKKQKSQHKVYSSNVELNVKIRKFRSYDNEFWMQGGLDEDFLRFGNVYPITHIFYKRIDRFGDLKESIIPADRLAYAYLEAKDNIQTIKTYQPYSKCFKWLTSHKDGVWDLWQQLPSTGDVLIITKSRKDALTIWKHAGIPCTSLQSESGFPKKQVVDELKSRFKNIFVLYDNDFDKDENHGRIYGAKIANEFKLPQIEIPTKLLSKDSFDLYRNHGEKIFKETIFNLIK